MAPKAFLFDVFGTVVDWRSGVASAAKPYLKSVGSSIDPFEFADRWRGKYQPAMSKIRSGNRGYIALDLLHRENLDELLAEYEIGHLFSESMRGEFNRAWEKLPPWPDSVPGLNRLRKFGIVAPCSNGSIALMSHLARFGNLPWDCILGAEIARNYKPQPETYLASVAALQLSPGEVAMVAAHNDDLHAARQCGLQTVFIRRSTEHGNNQQTDLEATGNWDYLAENIEDFSIRFDPDG